MAGGDVSGYVGIKDIVMVPSRVDVASEIKLAFENDFESVVFDLYPRLKSIKGELLRLGATSAMMSGSGSALFGFYDSRPKMEAARIRLGRETVIPVRTVTRSQYRQMWWRSLATAACWSIC